MRDPSTRKKFFLVVTKDEKAKDVASILTGIEARPSQYITNTIKNSTDYQGIATDISYSSFVNEVITDGINPSLTSISIIGDAEKGSDFSNIETTIPDATIVLGPIGIFKEDKLIGFADEDESMGINLILNDVNSFSIITNCDNDKIVSRIEDVSTKVEIYIKNELIHSDITISGIGSLIEVNCDIDLLNESVINNLEQQFEEETKGLVNKALVLTQNKYKSDIFGFGEKLSFNYPIYFDKIKNDWDSEYFPNIKTNIKVELDIETKGSLSQTIGKEANS